MSEPYTKILTQVKLQRYVDKDVQAQHNNRSGYFIRVVAEPVNPDDDPNIFLHQVEVVNPGSTDRIFSFTNVVTPADYNQVPIGPPEPDSPDPDEVVLFRFNEVRHFVRSWDELEKLWDSLVYEVNTLIKYFKTSQDLSMDAEITLG